MAYVEGFVLAIETGRKAEYTRLATLAGAVFKDHGALSVTECWGDDVPYGQLTSFPRAVACAPDETVVLAWVVWPSKDIRDTGNRKVFEDPRMTRMRREFSDVVDGNRMIFGGFVPIVEM